MDLQAYLRAERLAVDDPYEQDGLLPKERVDRRHLRVVFDNFYHSPRQKVYCHVCGGHRHHKGITGLFENGDRILFGSACAREYFGPEIAKLCSADLRRRTRNARSRFRILEFRNSTSELDQWISSYRPLVERCQSTWVEFKSRHPGSYETITTHLQRNNGRLIDTVHVSADGSTGKREYFESNTIILAVRSPEAVPYLTRVLQQVSLIEAFIDASRTVTTLDDERIVRTLNSMFNAMLQAAAAVDDALMFTADFFSEPKLSAIGSWLDDRRLERLRDQENLTARNTGKLMRKIMGYGFEAPPVSLLAVAKATKTEHLLSLLTPDRGTVPRLLSAS